MLCNTWKCTFKILDFQRYSRNFFKNLKSRATTQRTRDKCYDLRTFPVLFKWKSKVLQKPDLVAVGLIKKKKRCCANEASPRVAQRTAEAKDPRTIAQELLLPCAKHMVRIVTGSVSLIKSQPLFLENDTIRRKNSRRRIFYHMLLMKSKVLQVVCSALQSRWVNRYCKPTVALRIHYACSHWWYKYLIFVSKTCGNYRECKKIFSKNIQDFFIGHSTDRKSCVRYSPTAHA